MKDSGTLMFNKPDNLNDSVFNDESINENESSYQDKDFDESKDNRDMEESEEYNSEL